MSADSPPLHPDLPSTVVASARDKEAPIAIAVAAPAAPAPNVQFWLTLTPLLSILLTAVALVINSAITLEQTHEATKQRNLEATAQRAQEQQAAEDKHKAALAMEDEAWREALSKLTGSRGNKLPALLVMDTFGKSAQHGSDARAIAAELVHEAPYHSVFDVVLFDIKNNTTPDDQNDLLAVDRALTADALSLYATHIAHRPASTAMLMDAGFQNFVANPETALVAPGQHELQAQVIELNYRLDSVTSALVDMWAAEPHIPRNESLKGIILLNSLRREVDYGDRNLDLSRTAFLGECVLPAAVSQPAIIGCDRRP